MSDYFKMNFICRYTKFCV